MYILDTNFLITANQHMPIDSGHELWDKLIELSKQDVIKIPEEVLKELGAGNDNISTWVNENYDSLVLKTSDSLEFLPVVMTEYERGADNIFQEDIDFLDRVADPYIIAHALALGATIVTGEIYKSDNYIQKRPRNRKIPEICSGLKIECIGNFKFLWDIKN